MNTQRTGGVSGRAAAAVCDAAGGRAQAPGVGAWHARAGDTHPPRARACRVAAGEADAPGTRSGIPAGAVGDVPDAARRHPACEP
ncbi:hypothetical protein SAMN06272771_1233 [Streptomyces sp. Ag82_O1-12]|nr:hypothetical protein SAMN06272771_1233 [Streptomyces sp. Ag82_O1-12]SOD43946.1 hypothetical protein SAMN06272727_1224 [Streptomyces sp. Ag82_G6-1]